MTNSYGNKLIRKERVPEGCRDCINDCFDFEHNLDKTGKTLDLPYCFCAADMSGYYNGRSCKKSFQR